MDAGKPSLHYFNVKARAEVPRLILAAAGVDYNWVPVTDWKTTKADRLATGKYAFGQLPLYEEPDGFALVQSNAIIRYLGNKHGLAGSNAHEAALIDRINEGVVDLTNKFYQIHFYTRDETEKAAAKKKFVEETLPTQFGYFDAIAAKNSANGFFVGEKLSYGDLAFYDWHSHIKDWEGVHDLVDKHPHLKALLEKVANVPNVKAYAESNPYKN